MSDVLGGKYRIVRTLGSGSFGEVKLAEHRGLRVQRALKMLRADALGIGPTLRAEIRRRFTLESQIGAQLEQVAHVVHVYDFEEDDGALVLVMEYTPGGSLADRLAACRESGTLLEIASVVRIGCEVADGLAAVHDSDIVHRDVKPSNILFDAAGCARLADFGLAQMPYGHGADSRLGSATAPHPGPPAYMSPEQRSTFDHLSPASDIYMLGAVLFEMLTGRLWRNTRPGTTPRALRPAVPRRLDELVVRCLANDPEARPWDGAELRALLETAGDSGQLSAVGMPMPVLDGAMASDERVSVLALPEDVAMAFISVPAGSFLMGSDPVHDPMADDDETPQHRVSLDAYAMGRTVVTVAQFAAFVAATGYITDAERSGGSIALSGNDFVWVTGADWRHPGGTNGTVLDDHPVVHVTWDDAMAFCHWVSDESGQVVRLPTEAEWERAARGTDGRCYPWGDAAPDGSRANIGRRVSSTTPVGTYSPAGDSPCGCTDMVGNVWEWCNDWYAVDAYASAPQNNPTGPDVGTFRAVRGGAWYAEDDFARAALRLWRAPDQPHGLVGFRCVMAASASQRMSV